MRRFAIIALFTLFAAAFQSLTSIASAQQPGGPQAVVPKATIEGTVVRSPGGEPLARAQITISRTAPAAPAAGQPNPAATQPGAAAGQRGATPPATPASNANAAQNTASIAPIFTDDQGKFQIPDLEPGTYRLFAAHNGYTKMEYGQKLMNRPGTALNITAGQSMKDVTFKLTPAGTIIGRILDEQGEPLPGITVQVLRSTYDSNGKRTLQSTASAKSNDLGEYRVYFVAPGRYYVAATTAASGLEALAATAAQAGMQGLGNSNEVIAPGYVQTYYPNTTDASRAVAIEIQPGSEISGIHFTLIRQQRFHVKGRVIDVSTGKSPQTANITLSPRNSVVATNALDAILGATGGANNYNSADGTFELRDVAPGSYWLQVLAQGTPPAGGAATTPASATVAALAALTTAMMPIDVSSADIDNLTVATGNGVSIPGKIQLDGAVPGFTLDRLITALQPANGVVSLASALQQSQPSTEGMFSIEKVTAGEYRFVVGRMNPAMYVKSAKFDQSDILASGFDVSDKSPGTLQVVIGTNGGRIDATVLDKDSKPVSGILTMLIPDRNRDRRDVYKGGISDQNGRLTMLGIAPGDYKLFAWEDIEPYSFFDPEVLKQYEDKGKPIHIEESAKEVLDLKLIPAATP